jgi:uncharacterized membrane protein YedE/YeeE
MTIDWAAFTPWSSLAGGALVGLAAALLLLASGRVAGITGILAGVFAGDRPIESWRLSFLAGLVLAPVLVAFIGGGPVGGGPAASPFVLVLAGLLVGVGTRVGGGCTSGHGVCGLARFSPRSLVATLVFLWVGALVASLSRHLV